MAQEEIHIFNRIMEASQKCINLYNGKNQVHLSVLNFMLSLHQPLLFMLNQYFTELMEEVETPISILQVVDNLIH
jgi:hypothetical protein